MVSHMVNAAPIGLAAALMGAVSVAALTLGAPASRAQTPPPEQATLKVEVSNIKTPAGSLMVAVFASAEAYQGDVALHGSKVAVTGAAAEVIFTNLPAGQYAIKLFHDVDGDGRMNTNPFGLPIEPYAFSNNAPARFGPATWDAAVFTVTPGANLHAIAIR